MPRHSPCALISLTIFLVLRKNYAGHRSFSISRSNCSFTHNSTKKSVCFAFQRSTLCCLAYYLIIFPLFSFQGSIFQLLLQPDLKICLMPGLQIQQQLLFLYLVLRTRYDHTSRYTLGVICWWARVGSNHRPYDYQSYALAS